MNFIKKLLLSISFLGLVTVSKAVELSTQAQVSILTCGPGGELYSIFGHTAVRVQDPNTGMDLVFNYGTFDFNTEGFYVKFVRGKLDYMLSASSFNDFIETYKQEDRSVSEQVLLLTFSEKQAVMNFLEQNYKGNNKYYKYDFFYDNCTTRVRDLLSKVLGKSVVWNEKLNVEKSFRTSLDEYIVSMPWVKFGFYLGLGSVTDRKPTYFEAMFLPDRLQLGLEMASIQGKTSYKPLVGKVNLIYKSTNTTIISKPIITPELIFGFLLLLTIGLSFIQNKNGTQSYWFDNWLYGNTAIAGILVLFLWFGTDHKATANNMNFLWANPLWLLSIGTIITPKLSKFKINMQYLIIIITFNLAIFSPMFFQSFHPAFILIMLMLSIRAASNIWSLKTINIKH